MIDTIIFDADGVVVDTEAIWDKGQEEFLRRRGFQYDRQRIKPLLTGTSLTDGVRAMQREYGFGGDPAVLAQERIDIVKNLIRDEVGFINGFERFFAGVKDTYKTCLATAMDEDLLSLIDRHLSLSRLFHDRIFSPDRNGCRPKPHPDLFLYAAARLESKSESCVVIEDSPYGVEAARNAGMISIGLTTTYEPAVLKAADFIAGSYAEIDALFATSLDKERRSPSFAGTPSEEA